MHRILLIVAIGATATGCSQQAVTTLTGHGDTWPSRTIGDPNAPGEHIAVQYDADGNLTLPADLASAQSPNSDPVFGGYAQIDAKGNIIPLEGNPIMPFPGSGPSVVVEEEMVMVKFPDQSAPVFAK